MSKKTNYKIKDFASHEDFKGVFAKLKEIFNTDDAIFENLTRFFPDATPMDQIQIFSVYMSDSKDEYAKLVEEKGELTFDTTGKSELNAGDFWSIPLETMDVIYKSLNDDSDVEKFGPEWQIKNAKTLDFLREYRTTTPLIYNKAILIKTCPEYFRGNYIYDIIRGFGYLKINDVLNKLYSFLYQNRGTNFDTLLYYLRMRLYTLMKDVKGSHESNTEFEKALRSCSNNKL